ncbi:SpaA isopeptide-forming pilin-related protein [Companilactobacillus nantensis]|uniref:Adhesion exoprotein n=1 Tax=Companilactobacillus nantensis DSM 16982 TaxID=1423774 RepID=A0A0R1WBA7_9LACO|nr:SpaA isopeptide-forming pilin-related protein [Companilactobacillus nantensis]KRM15007.1 adhesion exoprotein [Companilactobacillus nantensis DSM 16982]GEO64962.1 peptidoglycan-binding protein [Companilactobacillus nantensis]
MGKKLRNFLVAFVAALGLVILVFSSQTTTTKAADYTTSAGKNGLLTGMSIQQKNYGTASNINLTLDWSSKDLQPDLANGDTWTVELPEQLKVKKPGETFKVVDDNGDVIGNAVLGIDSNGVSYVKVTFDNVDGKTDYEGSLNITDGIGVGKNYVIGNNDVQIGDIHDNMTITDSDDDFSKRGVIEKDADGNSIITWSILVNRNSTSFPNLQIKELINDDQSYIPGSLNIYEAKWSTTSPGFYSYDKNKPISGYKVDPNENSISDQFTISDLPKEDQFYVVKFQTKIVDQNNATNGHKFKNNASFTWGNNGSGTGGTNNQDNASGSVSGGTNSGNGNGVAIKGGVLLTKQSADDNSPLKGAEFSLYTEDGKLVAEKLTTDEKGQLSVDKLDKGNYYFIETKSPAGYEPNTAKIPFTISGKNSEVVPVITKDEPSTETHEDEEGSIIIMKVDKDTKYRLAGAKFVVKDADGNEVGTITTDSLGIGHMYNLKQGTYTIQEIDAPAGYEVSDTIHTVTIGDNNEDGSFTPELITFENTKDEDLVFDDSYFVKLHKVDEKDMSTGVPGAEYSLYTATGEFVEKKVTDENGMITIDGLKPGDYYFVETSAPNGYEINNDKLYFTIESGEQDIQTIQAVDSRTEGSDGGGNTTDPEDPDIDEKDDNEEDTNEGDNNNGGNEGNPDVDGNNEGNNSGNENNNNGGGVIVDPSNPGSNNNGNNNNNGGIITNPGSSNSTSTNNTLPQTGSKSGLAVSLMGLVILLGTVYFKRRHV